METSINIKELSIGFIGGWFSYYIYQKFCNSQFAFLPNFNRKYTSKICNNRDEHNMFQYKYSDEKKSLHMIIASQTDTISYLCKNMVKMSPTVNNEEKQSLEINSNSVNSSTNISVKDKKLSPLRDNKAPSTPPHNLSENKDNSIRKVEIIPFTSSSIDKELISLFEEEHQNQSKTIKEKLDVGRKIGEEPIAFFTNPNGNKYATVGEVKSAQSISEKFHTEKKMKRSDELEIIHAFNNIRGMNYFEGLEIVKKEGYTLHPVYINRGNKNPRKLYCGTVIGVSINDFEYDYLLNKPSNDAIIASIVDVGGQDSENRAAPSNL